MAYQLVLSSPTPATVPADGWTVGYKILGSGGPYTIAGPFMSVPITIPTADAVGTLYEGYITRDCGALESTQFFWQTPCNCTGVGYVPAPSGIECEFVETQPADVTNSGFCLATSVNNAYTNYGMRIYNPGFTTSDMNQGIGVINANIFGYNTTPTVFQNDPPINTTKGPMNREGVWIDSNCDGTKDPLSSGAQTTVAFVYNNVGPARQVFVGAGGDNQFQLVVNGTLIADTGTGGDLQFKYWHAMPVNIIPGPNFFNIVGTGDGSADDTVAMIIYDNTAAQLQAAATEGVLSILFRTSSLRGTSYDVATCPSGWSLDSSGGSGNYICVRTTYKSCNTLV